VESVRETIYVVDDDPSIRNSLELLFRSVGFNVQAYSDCRQFLEAGEPKPPACILLDIRMPSMSGLRLQEVLRTRGSDVPIVFISAHVDVPIAVTAMKAGAADLVEKPFSAPVLLETVQRVLDRHRALRTWGEDEALTTGRLDLLTARELEVAQLVAKGKSSKQIAAELRISARTVEVHRCRAVRKVGAQNTAELVRWLVKRSVRQPDAALAVKGEPSGRSW
jgi:FixJ family two-component response regulator